ncbi:MAG TPA: hypothetical protein IAC38_00445 [Candidatus Caccovivens faecavium]|nr:hypothetical protein [Candidatus Caccovivens faecavium]
MRSKLMKGYNENVKKYEDNKAENKSLDVRKKLYARRHTSDEENKKNNIELSR